MSAKIKPKRSRKMNKTKLFDIGSFKTQLIKIFEDEVLKTLNSHPEIFKKKYHDMVVIKVSHSTILFVEDELFKPNKDKKSFSRQFIVNTYNDGIVKRNSRPCYATFAAKTDDKGCIQIKKLIVKINMDLFIENALYHIWDFDNYIDINIRNTARHEAGHLLYYMQTYDGMNYEKYKQSREKVSKERDEFYTWVKSVTDDGRKHMSKELETERYHKYFNISVEAIADKLGNVDREKCIEYNVNTSSLSADIVIKTKRVFNPFEKTDDSSK